MTATIGDTKRPIDWSAKALILIAVLLVYASNWWPTRPVMAAGLQAFQLTKYERWGIYNFSHQSVPI